MNRRIPSRQRIPVPDRVLKIRHSPYGEGSAQGLILSPTLFNLMTADIPHPGRVTVYEYADDIVIAVTSQDLQEATNIIQDAINQIDEWASVWSLKMYPDKKSHVFHKEKDI